MDTPTPTPNKRIVIHIVTGRRAGLRRIVGTITVGQGVVPTSLRRVFEDDRWMDVDRIAEMPRYVLYRERFTPASIPVVPSEVSS